MQLAKCLVLVVASVLAGASTCDGSSLQLRSQHSLESKAFQSAFLSKYECNSYQTECCPDLKGKSRQELNNCQSQWLSTQMAGAAHKPAAPQQPGPNVELILICFKKDDVKNGRCSAVMLTEPSCMPLSFRFYHHDLRYQGQFECKRYSGSTATLA
jgi:hypothetical protein